MTYRNFVDQRRAEHSLVRIFNLVQIDLRSTHNGPDQLTIVSAVAVHGVMQLMGVVVVFRIGAPYYNR